VPDGLAATVAEAVPNIRASEARRRRDERASLERIYWPLAQHEQSDEPVRRGFVDLGEED
jgi:hypothetical protein